MASITSWGTSFDAISDSTASGFPSFVMIKWTGFPSRVVPLITKTSCENSRRTTALLNLAHWDGLRHRFRDGQGKIDERNGILRCGLCLIRRWGFGRIPRRRLGKRGRTHQKRSRQAETGRRQSTPTKSAMDACSLIHSRSSKLNGRRAIESRFMAFLHKACRKLPSTSHYVTCPPGFKTPGFERCRHGDSHRKM